MYRQQFITKNLHIVAKSRYISILREKKNMFSDIFSKTNVYLCSIKEEYKGKNIIKIGLQM